MSNIDDNIDLETLYIEAKKGDSLKFQIMLTHSCNLYGDEFVLDFFELMNVVEEYNEALEGLK